jgi:hypothetical protein
VAPGAIPYVIIESTPVDETNGVLGTVDGDVAQSWRTGIIQQSGPVVPYRFFSVCSALSDATVQVQAFSAPSDGDGLAPGNVSCPAGTRALSGGLGADVTQSGDRLVYTGPRDGAAAFPAADGSIATGWSVGWRNNAGSTRSFKATAVCATSTITSPPVDTTPPRTIKVGGPKKRIFKPRATFRFRSSEANSHFLCKLDRKPARRCRSPKTFRNLKPGKHKVTVRAIDAAGNRDATPIVYRFRYIKRRR